MIRKQTDTFTSLNLLLAPFLAQKADTFSLCGKENDRSLGPEVAIREMPTSITSTSHFCMSRESSTQQRRAEKFGFFHTKTAKKYE